MEYPVLNLFIGGQWLAGGRQHLDVINPASEEVLGAVPVATPEDVEQALQAAYAAFPMWRRTPVFERALVLRKAGGILRGRIDSIARLITLELGKPLAESEKEVITAVEMFEWAAEEARRIYGRIIPGRSSQVEQRVQLEPVGPVAAFSGWNAPAITPSRKIAGALAAGCTVVIKPSEETPAVALEIARALQEAGLPDGCLNMVFGDPGEISCRLLDSPLIRALTFTGSTSIGRSLAERAARGLKRTTLELGGHAPVLVFGDADLDAAISAVGAAKFRNSGQVCTSPTRMYIHDSVYEDFVQKLGTFANALKVGNGLEPGVQMGPMANPRRLEAMARLTEDAAGRGARVVAGGSRLEAQGWFWAPTVIADFDSDCMGAMTEPFGPVALLRPFSTFDEAVSEANRLTVGLASYVFGQHARTLRDASEALESGVVCINHCQASLPETPFGGIKDSGYGREGGTEGLQEFLQTKYVSQR